MKSFKNIISLIALVGFAFLIPLKTNALTIEEVIKNLNDLQPSNITNIKDAINYYDYQESIDEISSILDQSLNSSKQANDKLNELNVIMNSINDQNKVLLTIKDKKEYDNALDTLKEEVELAKQINSSAKTSSQEGLDKYNEAIEKYASLKSDLEDKKEKTEMILNANIIAVNAKLDAINSLLEELEKLENKLKEAFNKANNAYVSAKESATVANNNFSEKLEALKEYVEVNAEDELNDLIEVNTKYITSGILYASSQIALKLIDIEIDLIEAEIESLKGELVLLDQKLEPFKNEISKKESELAALKVEREKFDTIKNLENDLNKAKEDLTKYETIKNNAELVQNKCSNNDYINKLKSAISNKNYKEAVYLMLENEIFAKEITPIEEERLNSEFKNETFIIVTDNSKEYVFSYKVDDNGVVTIYRHELLNNEVTEIVEDFSLADKYLANFNGNVYKIGSINLRFTRLTGFFANGKAYQVRQDDKGNWIAAEKNLLLQDVSITNITVTEVPHYDEGTSSITSVSAITICDAAFDTSDNDNKIDEQKKLIKKLDDNLNNAKSLDTQINNKIAEKDAAIAEYDKQKEIITNKDGMTYADIETKIDELEDKLDHLPTSFSDLADLANLKNIINGASQGNVDVKSILETINNLNIGLNHKRTLVELLDIVLEKNYNNAKEELKEVVGEDLETISNILKELSPLINDVAESNLKLLEDTAKYELAKANYNAFMEAKNFILKEKDKALEELVELEKIKDENNLDLSDLESKIKQAEEALININGDVEVTINDYVDVKNENTETKNELIIDNINKDVKDENTETELTVDNLNIVLEDESETNIKHKINNSSKNDEKVEINDTIEESYEEVSDTDDGFNWLNLLWLLPIALILFFIIIFVKRRKDEE